MTILPWLLCPVVLLAEPVSPRRQADQTTGSRPAADEAVGEDLDLVDRVGAEYVAELARTVRARRDFDEPARTALAALLDAYARWDAGGPRLSSSQIVAAFERWTAATRRLDPQRRTDALLFADRVMTIVGRAPASGPDPRRDERDGGAPLPGTVRFAGAEFRYDKLGGGYVYGHTFLREAGTLTAPGADRDRVLLREMEIGFDYRGQCGAGDDVTAKIVASGEALLVRSSDPAVRAQAHLMAADAFATIVLLASGDAAEYFDTNAYRRREPRARREAIAHYRAALAIEPNPLDAELVRRDLQRLLDGKAPRLAGSGARNRIFYCVYD